MGNPGDSDESYDSNPLDSDMNVLTIGHFDIDFVTNVSMNPRQHGRF